MDGRQEGKISTKGHIIQCWYSWAFAGTLPGKPLSIGYYLSGKHLNSSSFQTTDLDVNFQIIKSAQMFGGCLYWKIVATIFDYWIFRSLQYVENSHRF